PDSSATPDGLPARSNQCSDRPRPSATYPFTPSTAMTGVYEGFVCTAVENSRLPAGSNARSAPSANVHRLFVTESTAMTGYWPPSAITAPSNEFRTPMSLDIHDWISALS